MIRHRSVRRRLRSAGCAVVFAFAWCCVGAFAPAFAEGQPGAPEKWEFDVVSIVPNRSGTLIPTMRRFPDGSISNANVTPFDIMSAAFEDELADRAGVPRWAFTERFDVTARVSPGRRRPTAEERRAMMRALLVNRFGLAWHMELREGPAYDLIRARQDGRLGPGLEKSTTDCAAIFARRRADADAAVEAGLPLPRFVPAPDGTPPPCALRGQGDRYEGVFPIAYLAPLLRSFSGRQVVDKTGLTGSYRLSFEAPPATFDRAASGGAELSPGGVGSLFTAVQEQLGLKLVPSRASRRVLVVDRVERPTAN